MQASVEVVAGTPVRAVMLAQRLWSRSIPSQLAEVPFQAMASTSASARRSAASSIADGSNCLSAGASNPISVTRNREKCAVTPGHPASIAQVTGSSTEFEDGVIMPRRLRTPLIQHLPFNRPELAIEADFDRFKDSVDRGLNCLSYRRGG